MSNSNSTTWDAELVALRDTILEDAAALGRPVTLREAAEMARNQIGALREYAADWDGFSDAVLLANHWPTDTDHAKVAGELSKFAAAWDAYAAQLAAMAPQTEPPPPAAPAARTAGDRLLAEYEDEMAALGTLAEREAGMGERRIDRVLAWIDSRYSEALGVEEAARLVHVSPAAFSRYFRREVGKRFSEYVNDVRCSEACLLLARGERSVAAIAQACGFETLSNFSRQFQRRHGVTPGAFRKARRPA